MNTDSYFEQGAGHTICQDYADTFNSENLAIAVVCDGCSDSPKSEIGAGILAQAFLSSYTEAYNPDNGLNGQSTYLQALTRNKLRDIGSRLRMAHKAFNATVVAVAADKLTNKLQLFMWGDGHIVLKYKNGEYITYSSRYTNGAPYYFSYSLNELSGEAYQSQFGSNESEIEMADYLNGVVTPMQVMNGKPFFSWEIDLDVIESAAVYSDGLETFSDSSSGDAVSMPLGQVFKEVAEFKNTVGTFVKRRLARFKKDCIVKKVSHFDDISCAAILI